MSLLAPTEKQARLIWIALSALAVAVILTLLGVILWGVGMLLNKLAAVLMPMALAVILAYVLEPVVQYFESKKISRFRSVSLVFILAVMLLGLAGGYVLPDLIRQSKNMATELPKNIAKLRAKTDRYIDKSSPWVMKLSEKFVPPPSTNHTQPQLNAQTNSAIQTNFNSISNQVDSETAAMHSDGTDPNPVNSLLSAKEGASPTGPMLDSLQDYLVIIIRWLGSQLGKVTTWAEFLIGFVLVPVYLFYFLLEKEAIVRKWRYYLPIKDQAAKDEVVFILQSINDCMLVFFRGQVLVAMCVGALLAVGYTVMGLRYSILLGLVAGLLGIVPYLGTVVSLALALVVAATQFGDWYHPLMVLAIAGCVKLVEDLVISPKIVGERSGLHPLTTIVAVLAGSTLMGGFLGALLAIPLTATLRVLLFRYIWSHCPKTPDSPFYEAHPPTDLPPE